MKRVIILGLVLGFTAGAASAQTTGSNSSRSTSISSTGTYNAKGGRPAIKLPSSVLDNTKIYHWQDGQRATPTGHEAAPIDGSYQSLKRKSPVVRSEDDN